jgi:hypothetical protein
MPIPDLHILWETQDLVRRAKETLCAATGEISSGRTKVCVENGIANEDVVYRNTSILELRLGATQKISPPILYPM